jgi:molybdopterin-guanine dinucleotide biosynthesis protein A
MTTTATLQRRLIRTKEAATYLSMSDWKLRRLIQEGTFPVVQDHEEAPSSSIFGILTAMLKTTNAQFPTTTHRMLVSR